jgi:hypothetical protein
MGWIYTCSNNKQKREDLPHKKTTAVIHGSCFLISKKLLLDDSFDGALLGAGAALNAGISVDGVDIALSNGLSGALGSAGTASDASVSDLICHKAPPKELYSHCNIIFANCKGKNRRSG